MLFALVTTADSSDRSVKPITVSVSDEIGEEGGMVDFQSSKVSLNASELEQLDVGLLHSQTRFLDQKEGIWAIRVDKTYQVEIEHRRGMLGTGAYLAHFMGRFFQCSSGPPSQINMLYSNESIYSASRAMIAFRSRPLYRGSSRDCMGCRTCESAPLGVRGARTCVFASLGMRDLIVYCGFNRRRNEHTNL